MTELPSRRGVLLALLLGGGQLAQQSFVELKDLRPCQGATYLQWNFGDDCGFAKLRVVGPGGETLEWSREEIWAILKGDTA